MNFKRVNEIFCFTILASNNITTRSQYSKCYAFSIWTIFNDTVKEKTIQQLKQTSGRVDKEYATETVNSGSIPSRVKPKTLKIGIHSYPS